VYESEVPAGGAEAQEMVRLDTEVNVACAAAVTVIVRDAVDMRPQVSVNVQDSEYEPPHSLCVPLISLVTDPLISHEPVSPLPYEREVPVGGAELQLIVRLETEAKVA
jgi:hypothetical protein